MATFSYAAKVPGGVLTKLNNQLKYSRGLIKKV
jgi:hypothetical protein